MSAASQTLTDFVGVALRCYADKPKREDRRRRSSLFGWDSWARTSKAGVKVPCVTVTPYPNTVLLYAVYRLLSVYHVSPRLSIQRLARRGGQLFRECLAVPRAQHRSAAAIGRAAVSPAGRGGLLFSASDFRTRDPAASPAACGQADDALFSRVAAFFFRGARRLCRYMRFYSFGGVFILTKSACCVTI